MTAALAWVLVPLLLALVSLGCGLALERVAAVRLPRALLFPAGFAVVVVLTQFPPLSPTTARVATPLVVAVAFAGFALSAQRLRGILDGWALAAGAGATVAFAAPAAASGSATFAGYIKLDDTATYLAMLDRIAAHGRDLGGLAPSTYEATLATSLAYGYPIGSVAPLGAIQQLLAIDAAWLWQPYLASLGGLLALALYALARPLTDSRPLRALVAVAAAQPAILYGYSLWGGVKELAAAVLVATLCATVRTALEAETPRGVLPLAATAAAITGVLSLGGAIWLLPLGVALVLLWRRRGTAFSLRAAGVFLVAACVFAIPAFVAATDWLGHSSAFTSDGELGNLIRPLKLAQLAGIWPVGDFRHSPSELAPTYLLIAVVVAAAVGGTVWAWRRAAVETLLYAGGAIAAALVLYEAASPWIAGKGLATAAPAVVLLGLAGAVALFTTGRTVEAAVVAGAIVAGIAWSNVLAYRDVWLAPQPRLAELESIGKRYAGQGPALMTEFEPYGVRHFLRGLDAEGASELRRDVVPLRSGQPLPPQGYADIDRFSLRDLLAFRTLVLRRSPVLSRPPSVYRLVERRRWYDVWERDPRAPRIIEHVPLGTELDPAAVPRCADVLRLARLSTTRRLVAVPRPSLELLRFPSKLPTGWSADVGDSVDARRSGAFAAHFELGGPGSYAAWLGGSFLGEVAATVDGHHLGSARHQLEWPGQYVELGQAALGAGTHEIELTYKLGGWRPGSHGLGPFPMGPLVLATTRDPRVVSVTPSAARTLCGRRLDWVEAVG